MPVKAPTRLYIYASKYLENFRRVRSAIGKHGAVMAVIKSNGYGVGALHLARILSKAEIEHFAVAYLNEALLLRSQGISTAILVQNFFEHEVNTILTTDFSIQISCFEQLHWLETGSSQKNHVVAVHVKIDTGMGRAGFLPNSALKAIQIVQKSSFLRLEGIMTHFAAADDPEEDEFTQQQVATFDSILQKVKPLPQWIHASNSAGVLRFPSARYTMVRMGIGLLGYSNAPDPEKLALEPILRLVSKVISVKNIKDQQTVGYGRTYKANGVRKIAMIAIGYNDGYSRLLSEKAKMSIHGQTFPVAGRVCMDVTMLDVTDAKKDIQAGDDVVVFGFYQNETRLEELAQLINSIPYELLTRLSNRIDRNVLKIPAHKNFSSADYIKSGSELL